MQIYFTSASDFVSATAEKITSFRSLPVGWHYSQGGPLSDNVINKALQIDSYYRQLGFTATDAFPGADGELMITAYRGPHCIETVISSDARYSVTHERDDTEISATLDVDETTAKRTITRIGGEIWRSLGSSVLFMESTTTKGRRGLEAWRSKTQEMAGFLLFSGTAWMTQSDQFVNISGSTTQRESLANLQFTGSSSNQYFLQKIA